MKYYLYLTLVLVSLYPVQVLGQGTMIKVNFAPALPLGGTADFTGNFTGRGANFEFYKMKENKLGYGIELGTMNSYEEVSGQTHEQGTASLTGKQYRFLKITPVMASFIYIFNSEKTFRPFVAIGAGIGINTQKVSMGIFVDKTEARQLIIRPEIGAIYQLSDYVGIKLSSKYYQTFKNSDMRAHTMMGFNLGFVMLNFYNQ